MDLNSMKQKVVLSNHYGEQTCIKKYDSLFYPSKRLVIIEKINTKRTGILSFQLYINLISKLQDCQMELHYKNSVYVIAFVCNKQCFLVWRPDTNVFVINHKLVKSICESLRGFIGIRRVLIDIAGILQHFLNLNLDKLKHFNVESAVVHVRGIQSIETIDTDEMFTWVEELKTTNIDYYHWSKLE